MIYNINENIFGFSVIMQFLFYSPRYSSEIKIIHIKEHGLFMKKTAAFILAILSVFILVSCTKVEKFKDDAGNVIKKVYYDKDGNIE